MSLMLTVLHLDILELVYGNRSKPGQNIDHQLYHQNASEYSYNSSLI